MSSGDPRSKRLRPDLAAPGTPLIHLWGWPGSDLEGLLAALEASDSEIFVGLPADASEARRKVAARAGGGRRFLFSAPVLERDALSPLLEALAPGQRLVVAAPRRSLSAPAPAFTVPPVALCLERGEVAALLPVAADGGEDERSAAAPDVDSLHRFTGGWLEPLRWLIAGDVLESETFVDRFRRRVVAAIEPAVVDLLRELRFSESVEPERWRLAWHDQGERLAAFERLLHAWGLVGPDGRLPGPWWRSRWSGDDAPSSATVRRLAAADQLLGRPVVTAGAPPPPDPVPAMTGGTGGGAVAPRFELQLLGEPRVVRRLGGERRELRWRLRRAFATVAYLALADGRRARKDELVEALWPDAGERVVRRNFHPTLSAARRTLSGGAFDTLSYSQEVYALDPGVEWWIDTEAFTAACERGQEQRAAGHGATALDSWTTAWRLYRGPLLAPLDAAWIRAPRAELQRRYLVLLRRLGELAAELGRHTLAVDVYRTLLLEEPFEEPVHRALMELYAEAGRRDLVRRQYVRLQELLLEELSVEPSVETQERYHELMR